MNLYVSPEETYSVSFYETFTDRLKLKDASLLDEILSGLAQEGQLKGVSKSSKGSPDLQVVYNTEIKRADHKTWSDLK